MTDRLSSILQETVVDAAAGVVDAERRATEQRVVLRDQLESPPEQLVAPEEADRLLAERFPLPTLSSERESGATAVAPGEPYLRPDLVEFERVDEYPPVEDELGLRLEPEVLQTKDGVPRFTEEAVQRVRDELSRPVGERRKRVLDRLFQQGVPRPVVENMETDVKVRFDDGLNATPIDALNGSVVPEAVGKIHAQLHFESE